MEPFTRVTAVAAPLLQANIDTDRLVPARFLSRPRGQLGDVLFHDLRFSGEGIENPDFPLNRPEFRKAEILIAGRNFGCGSSREAAVWALRRYGFRTVIASSFGDIFYNNCFKNFVLPVVLSQERAAALAAELEASPGAVMRVDLERQVVVGPNGSEDHFDVDPFLKHSLLTGQDELAMTLSHVGRIEAFEAAHGV